MRAGWWGSWGKMGGQAMKAGEIVLAGPHTCYWGRSWRGAHALAGLRVRGRLVEPVQLGAAATANTPCPVFSPWVRPSPKQHAYLLFGFALARANARMLRNAASTRSSAVERPLGSQARRLRVRSHTQTNRGRAAGAAQPSKRRRGSPRIQDWTLSSVVNYFVNTFVTGRFTGSA